VSDPVVYVKSNLAKLRNRQAVLRILAEHRCPDLCFHVHGKQKAARGAIRIHGEGWPLALKEEAFLLDEWKEMSEEEMDQMWNWQGPIGFEELLERLAPHLLTPLIVQAVQFIVGEPGIHAWEWGVQPGANQVEITRLKYTEAIVTEDPAA
jgi:hypothetical protein